MTNASTPLPPSPVRFERTYEASVYRFVASLLLLALFACNDDDDETLGAAGGTAGAAGASNTPLCELPTNFTWTSSDELIAPVSDADHDLVSIKDPTVVRFEDRWHVYATTANTDGEWSLAYLSFEDWADAADATPHYMDQTPGFAGYLAAPHVFYFTPQKLWYLVFQTQPPKYSTTDDIADPSSWSEPRSFFTAKPRSAPELWIDYWVICDDSHCYLFFTGDDGALYRSRTTVEDFPDRMDDPVLAMRMGKSELFEGSATYKIKGLDEYLTLVEAIGPAGTRYYKAWTAEALDGAWTPIANSFDRPFAGESNVTFAGTPWTRDISHSELLRDGYDEHLVVDVCGGALQMLYQGQDPEAGQAASDYSQKPYRLGLLTQGPSDPDLPPLDLPPTPADPPPTTPTGDNLLVNPGFESGTTGWTVWGGTLATVSEPVHGGSRSALVSNRSDTWNGTVQDILAKVEPGQTYLASVWVRIGIPSEGTGGAGGAGGSATAGAAGAGNASGASNASGEAGAGGAAGASGAGGAGGAADASGAGGAAGTPNASEGGSGASQGATQPVTLTMKAVCGEDESYTSVASGEALIGQWVELRGTLDAPTCTNLLELVLYVEGPAAGVDLYVDDASLAQ